MAFHSLRFLIFFAITALMYFVAPRRYRWGVLLCMSYVFYLCSDLRAVFFLLFSTAATYGGARLLERENRRLGENLAVPGLDAAAKRALRTVAAARKRRWCGLILLTNLGLLAAVRYTAFALETVNALLPLALPVPSLLQPLGLSFYVLQSTGYLLDVYREEHEAEHSFLRYALFVGFFPQLIQGPITRHSEVAEQLSAGQGWSFENAARGLQLMLWGFFKKLVIADLLAVPVTAVFGDHGAYGGVLMFLAAALYGLQLYCDFSGGIDVARGVARFFGIGLPENFRQPYFSTSVAVFWRRWHITLGGWMRDYLFYPLTLSRPIAALGKFSRKKWPGHFGRVLPSCLVSVIVFLVVGLWHGGAWKYVVYGLWHACFIALGNLLGPFLRRRREAMGLRDGSRSLAGLKGVLTFGVVTLGYFFFRADTLSTAISMLRRSIAHPWTHQLFDGSLAALGLGGAEALTAALSLLLLLAVGILRERGHDMHEWLLAKPWAAQWAVLLLLTALTLYFGIFSDYVASEYIYMNF